jgi:hypothetical protein
MDCTVQTCEFRGEWCDGASEEQGECALETNAEPGNAGG